jgi:DNA (cytosine-5)-methyltransferase 1
MIVDIFAGPGGWDTGARLAGHTAPIVGVEWDDAACRTAIAAGHPRIRADVSTFDPTVFAGLVDGLIGSPPCQAWSMAGDRKGEFDREAVYARIAAFAAGREPDAEYEWADERSHLTAEPMRWAVALAPRWIACEQVPAVLPLWQYMAELLRKQGYRAWAGILSAEEFGVPQTRKRAILIGRNDGIPAGPPAPTHQAYRSGRQVSTDADLFGDLLPPPVSMAQALGWGMTERPSITLTAGSGRQGGPDPLDGGSGARATLRRERDLGNWRSPGASALDWVRMHPAGIHGSYGYSRSIEEPSPTIKGAGSGGQYVSDGKETARVTVQEAAVLQSFPADYPWQGTKSAQYRCVGDAVPPLLAAAILRPLIHDAAEMRKAA